MLKVNAGELVEALKPTKPHLRKKRPKPFPVSLEQEFVSGELAVIEAKHGVFAKSIATSGYWPGHVQVDGVLLGRLAATWPPEAELELSADAEALTVRVGKFVSRVARIDGGGANPIKRTPPKPDKRHKGKVEVPPDPVGKRVKLSDTWAFSARVPMPQHRNPNDGK